MSYDVDLPHEFREVKAAIGGVARDLRRRSAGPARRGRERDDDPGALLWKALAAQVIDTARANEVTEKASAFDQHASKAYFSDLLQVTRMAVRTKASQPPASTTGSGWGAELAVDISRSFYDSLAGLSVFARLAGPGGARTFNPGRGDASVSIVSPTGTRPQINASFIAELAPYPTRRATLTSAPLLPKKAGNISYFSEELAERSPLLVEQLVRDLIASDTALYLDSVLTSTSAATSTTPPGLRSYGAALTPATAASKADLMQADLGAMIAAVQPATRVAVLAAPAQAAALAMAFVNTPLVVFTSMAIPARVVIVLDLDSLALVLWSAPQFVVSREAAFHADDAPTALSAVGSPNTVAAPLVSMFQADELAVRFTQYVNWILARGASSVSWMSGVNW